MFRSTPVEPLGSRSHRGFFPFLSRRVQKKTVTCGLSPGSRDISLNKYPMPWFSLNQRLVLGKMFITHRLTIQEVNNLLSENFVRIFGNIVEHFPAAAIGILKKRPFEDVSSIVRAVNDLLDELKTPEKEQILGLYPDTIESLTKNDFLNMDREDSTKHLTIEETVKLMDLDKRYKEKFGFPFIIGSEKSNDVYNVFSELISRIQNEKDDEVQVAMKEVKSLVSLRIHELVQ